MSNEETRFIEVLAFFTKKIPEPPQRMGRPRLPLGEMVFACVYMVYVNLSARDTIPRLELLRDVGVLCSSFHHNSLSNYMNNERLSSVLDELCSATSSLTPRGVSDEEQREWDWFAEDWLDKYRWRAKGDVAEENETMCTVIVCNIREFIARHADPLNVVTQLAVVC